MDRAGELSYRAGSFYYPSFEPPAPAINIRGTNGPTIKLMVDGAFQSKEEATLKLVRAKQTSTQLSTYFVGRMAHVRMREKVQREQGEKFNLSRYHEAVLSQGSVPMKYLPELVDRALR